MAADSESSNSPSHALSPKGLRLYVVVFGLRAQPPQKEGLVPAALAFMARDEQTAQQIAPILCSRIHPHTVGWTIEVVYVEEWAPTKMHVVIGDQVLLCAARLTVELQPSPAGSPAAGVGDVAESWLRRTAGDGQEA